MPLHADIVFFLNIFLSAKNDLPIESTPIILQTIFRLSFDGHFLSFSGFQNVLCLWPNGSSSLHQKLSLRNAIIQFRSLGKDLQRLFPCKESAHISNTGVSEVGKHFPPGHGFLTDTELRLESVSLRYNA